MVSYSDYINYKAELIEINEKIEKYNEFLSQLKMNNMNNYSHIAFFTTLAIDLILAFKFGEKATIGILVICIVTGVAMYFGHLKDEDEKRKRYDYKERIPELEARKKILEEKHKKI